MKHKFSRPTKHKLGSAYIPQFPSEEEPSVVPSPHRDGKPVLLKVNGHWIEGSLVREAKFSKSYVVYMWKFPFSHLELKEHDFRIDKIVPLPED